MRQNRCCQIFIGNERLKSVAFGKRFDLDDVGPLARTQHELQRVAQRVNRRVHFCGEASARATERFGAGVAFFDLRRAGEHEQLSYRSSSIPSRVLAKPQIRAPRPFFVQRSKRLNTEFHLP